LTLSRFGPRLALVAAIAGLLRVAHAVFVAPPIGLFGDGWFFHEVSRLVSEGQGYVSPAPAIFEGIEKPTAEHPPLFTLLLAGLHALGVGGEEAQRAVCGSLLGAGTVALVGLLGRRLGGDRAGLLAAVLAALYPTLIAADGSLLSETLYGLLIAALLLAALRLLERPSPAGALLLGALCGLAALTRSEALLLVALLALPVALFAGRRAAAGGPRRPGASRPLALAAIVLVATVAVLAPWTARNLTTFDRPVLISTNDGTTLTGSNCDATYGGSRLGSFLTTCIPRVRFDDESRQAVEWRRVAFDFMGDHAGRVPLVVAARLGRTWGVFRVTSQASDVEGRRRWVQAAGLVAFYPLLALAIYGAAGLWRRRLELAVMLGPVVLVTLTATVTYGGTRPRHAAEIPIVTLAGVGLDRFLLRRSRDR
jgi:4-amino-4-deoxy-L-arabinose transferase-like glycosyltransferase